MGRRWVKVLAVIVVVLIGLFVAADRIAVHEADGFIAKKADETYAFANSTNAYTTVDIHGFPFLTQAAGRRLDDVTLTAGDFTVSDTRNTSGGYLTVDRIQLDLSDVRLSSSFKSAESGGVTGTAAIGWTALSQAVGRMAHTGGLTVAPVTVTGDNGLAHRSVPVHVTAAGTGSADGTVSVQGNAVQVSVPGSGQTPVTWPITLPNGLSFVGIRTTHDDIVLLISGSSVTFGGYVAPLGS